jgi:hypothetical protein
MEQGPLPLGEALRYARDIANHLRELHEEGRVHGEAPAHDWLCYGNPGTC